MKRHKEKIRNIKAKEGKEIIFCCTLCDEIINKGQGSVKCTQCKEWVHLICSKFDNYKDAKANMEKYKCTNCEIETDAAKKTNNEIFTKKQYVNEPNKKSNENLIENTVVNLTESDVETIMDEKWLNDNVIAYVFNKLQQKHDSFQKNILFVKPAVTQLIKASTDDKNTEMTIEDLRLKKVDWVFFPLNNNLGDREGGSHWSLLVYQTNGNTFYHFDSISGMNNRSVAMIIKKLIKNEYKIPEVKYVKCPRQKNGYDCGPFTLMFADNIAKNIKEGVELTKIGDCNAKEYRMKLQQTLEKEQQKGEKLKINKDLEIEEKKKEKEPQTSKDKVERIKECWHHTNRTCKFEERCRYKHKKHCKEMIENGYCFDKDCNLGHPIICSDIYETGSCKRYVCRHFHPLNLRNKNQKNRRNQIKVSEEQTRNRQHTYLYKGRVTNNTRPQYEFNQWENKRDHRNNFLENQSLNLIEIIEPLMKRTMSDFAEIMWNKYRN